jgi:cytochrome oxidase assembly protein ShyY1
VLALLRTQRWIAFTALVLGVIIAFGFLSRWQWQRAEEKRLTGNEIVSRADAPAQPLDPSNPPPEWTVVSLVGEYSPETLMVRQRPQGGQNGAWVLSTLNLQSGPQEPSKVWVSRGWLAVTGAAIEIPTLPNPPNGEVRLTGVWRPYQPVDPDRMEGLPSGMVPAIGPPAVDVAGYAPGYVQLQPAEAGLAAVEIPTIDDARNLSYAIQWILFALVGLISWWFFLRREAREDAVRAASREEVLHEPA